MTITPRAPYDTGDMLTALCVWRESRGCTYEAMRGVVWVLKNRCAMAPAQGFAHTMQENILKPWAFSSFNSKDPNSGKYPNDGDESWVHCMEAVSSTEPDNTDGAVFYFSRPMIEAPKVWGDVIVTAQFGGLTFCGFSERIPEVVT